MIVAKRAELLDQAAYDGERAGDPIGEWHPAAACATGGARPGTLVPRTGVPRPWGASGVAA